MRMGTEMNKVALVVALMVGALAWGVIHYRHNAIAYKNQREEKARQLKLANETITDMQTRQRDVAALDAKYTQELADAQSETDALRRKLDDGGRVLVKGRCPVPASTQSTGTASVGDAGAIELSDVAGRNVLSIRAGIQRDHAALKALQEYIRTQCFRW